MVTQPGGDYTESGCEFTKSALSASVGLLSIAEHPKLKVPKLLDYLLPTDHSALPVETPYNPKVSQILKKLESNLKLSTESDNPLLEDTPPKDRK